MVIRYLSFDPSLGLLFFKITFRTIEYLYSFYTYTFVRCIFCKSAWSAFFYIMPFTI